MSAELLVEFEVCDDCSHYSCGYYFIHYKRQHEECSEPCPDADELDDQYPQGWRNLSEEGDNQ